MLKSSWRVEALSTDLATTLIKTRFPFRLSPPRPSTCLVTLRSRGLIQHLGIGDDLTINLVQVSITEVDFGQCHEEEIIASSLLP